jgi:hypothetical protein
MGVALLPIMANHAYGANVTVTISNNQGTATVSNFQQLVYFDPGNSLFSSQISSDLGNIRFYSGSTPIYSWCESNCSSSGTNSVFWILLPSGIGANSNVTLNMTFLSTGTEYNGGTAGEAPQFSASYAEYDNGANVFLPGYWNFEGTSTPSGWTQTGSGIVVDNGVQNDYMASGQLYTGWSNTSQTLDVMTSQGAATNGGWLLAGLLNPGTYNHGTGSVPDGTTVAFIGKFGGGTSILQDLPTDGSYSVISIDLYGSGSVELNYGAPNSTSLQGSYIGFLHQGPDHSGGSSQVMNPSFWMRLRATPPDDVMPSVSFSAFSDALAIPTPSPTTQTIYQSESANVVDAGATGGTSPYAYQWLATTAGGNTLTGGQANSICSDAQARFCLFNTNSLTGVGVYKFELSAIDSASNMVTSGEVNVILTAPPIIASLSPSSNTLRDGSLVKFVPTVSGGTPPYFYSWTTNAPFGGACYLTTTTTTANCIYTTYSQPSYPGLATGYNTGKQLSAGNYLVSLHITDSASGSAYANAVVRVLPQSSTLITPSIHYTIGSKTYNFTPYNFYNLSIVNTANAATNASIPVPVYINYYYPGSGGFDPTNTLFTTDNGMIIPSWYDPHQVFPKEGGGTPDAGYVFWLNLSSLGSIPVNGSISVHMWLSNATVSYPALFGEGQFQSGVANPLGAVNNTVQASCFISASGKVPMVGGYNSSGCDSGYNVFPKYDGFDEEDQFINGAWLFPTSPGVYGGTDTNITSRGFNTGAGLIIGQNTITTGANSLASFYTLNNLDSAVIVGGGTFGYNSVFPTYPTPYPGISNITSAVGTIIPATAGTCSGGGSNYVILTNGTRCGTTSGDFQIISGDPEYIIDAYNNTAQEFLIEYNQLPILQVTNSVFVGNYKVVLREGSYDYVAALPRLDAMTPAVQFSTLLPSSATVPFIANTIITNIPTPTSPIDFNAVVYNGTYYGGAPYNISYVLVNDSCIPTNQINKCAIYATPGYINMPSNTSSFVITPSNSLAIGNYTLITMISAHNRAYAGAFINFLVKEAPPISASFSDGLQTINSISASQAINTIEPFWNITWSVTVPKNVVTAKLNKYKLVDGNYIFQNISNTNTIRTKNYSATSSYYKFILNTSTSNSYYISNSLTFYVNDTASGSAANATYNVIFNEQGLPPGTFWNSEIDGNWIISNHTSVFYKLRAGSAEYNTISTDNYKPEEYLLNGNSITQSSFILRGPSTLNVIYTYISSNNPYLYTSLYPQSSPSFPILINPDRSKGLVYTISNLGNSTLTWNLTSNVNLGPYLLHNFVSNTISTCVTIGIGECTLAFSSTSGSVAPKKNETVSIIINSTSLVQGQNYTFDIETHSNGGSSTSMLYVSDVNSSPGSSEVDLTLTLNLQRRSNSLYGVQFTLTPNRNQVAGESGLTYLLFNNSEVNSIKQQITAQLGNQGFQNYSSSNNLNANTILSINVEPNNFGIIPGMKYAYALSFLMSLPSDGPGAIEAVAEPGIDTALGAVNFISSSTADLLSFEGCNCNLTNRILNYTGLLTSGYNPNILPILNEINRTISDDLTYTATTQESEALKNDTGLSLDRKYYLTKSNYPYMISSTQQLEYDLNNVSFSSRNTKFEMEVAQNGLYTNFDDIATNFVLNSSLCDPGCSTVLNESFDSVLDTCVPQGDLNLSCSTDFSTSTSTSTFTVPDPSIPFINIMADGLEIENALFNTFNNTLSFNAIPYDPANFTQGNISITIPPELNPSDSDFYYVIANGIIIPSIFNGNFSSSYHINATINSIETGTVVLHMPTLVPTLALTTSDGLMFASGGVFVPNTIITLQYSNSSSWTTLNSLTVGSTGTFSYTQNIPYVNSTALTILATDSDGEETLATASIFSTNASTNSSIPITLANSQGSETSQNFQQMIQFNPANYVGYEASDLGNIRFYQDGFQTSSNELYSWCESGCSSSATNSVFWVLLSNSIPPDSNVIINMTFVTHSSANYEYDGNYAGEAPQLSSSYAEYDNGVKVFPFLYQNFVGNSVPTGWTAHNGNGNVLVNNGVTLTWASTSGAASAYIQTTTDYGLNSSQVSDIYGTIASSSCGLLNSMLGFTDITSSFGAGWSCNGSGSGGFLDEQQNSGGVTEGSLTAPRGTNSILTTYWSSSSSSTYQDNYGTPETLTTHLPSSGEPFGGLMWGGTSSNEYIQWVRFRTYPPNGIMPTVTFGTIN